MGGLAVGSFLVGALLGCIVLYVTVKLKLRRNIESFEMKPVHLENEEET